MVDLHYISCLRYTILVGNPQYGHKLLSNLLFALWESVCIMNDRPGFDLRFPKGEFSRLISTSDWKKRVLQWPPCKAPGVISVSTWSSWPSVSIL